LGLMLINKILELENSNYAHLARLKLCLLNKAYYSKFTDDQYALISSILFSADLSGKYRKFPGLNKNYNEKKFHSITLFKGDRPIILVFK